MLETFLSFRCRREADTVVACGSDSRNEQGLLDVVTVSSSFKNVAMKNVSFTRGMTSEKVSFDPRCSCSRAAVTESKSHPTDKEPMRTAAARSLVSCCGGCG